MLKIINQSEATSKYQLPDSTEKEYSAKSNEATVLYMTDAFTKVRSTAKTFGEPDEEIEQTLVLTNQTEYDITDVTIQETIGEGVTFKEGSVTVDDTPYANFDVTTGYLLPNGVPAGETVTVKYTVKIATELTAQTSDLDTLITYTINEAVDLEEHANKITINLSANMLTIKKESDKTAVISGQKIMFQNVIENKGNFKNTQIIFKDPMPEGASFVAGSVKIDNVEKADYDPTVGFSIDDLEPGGKVTITFEVTVN